MDPEQALILRSALGLVYADRPYRNHYCAPSGGETRERCDRMAESGLLRAGQVMERSGNRYFYVTDAGAAAVGHTLPQD